MEQNLRETAVRDLSAEVFTLFEKRQPQLAAGDRSGFNTMTIGWGGLGTLWKKPVCTVYVRPQRYTWEFTEKSDYFTVSVFPAEIHKNLTICGTKSGRDVDKVKECGLTPAFSPEGAPYFEEAELVLVCRKLYSDDLCPERFCDASIDEAIYPAHDYHRFYIGEVLRVLKK